jgi:response regulator RpfG family c-di-GMP phosphodiesterase
LAVAGVFDALTMKRSLYAARQYLEDKKGREFDPALAVGGKTGFLSLRPRQT